MGDLAIELGAPGAEGRVICGAAGIGGEEPEQDVDAQNDGAGAAQEELRAVPHVADDDAQQGPFVRGQLHDEHGRFAPEQGLLEQPGHEQGD